MDPLRRNFGAPLHWPPLFLPYPTVCCPAIEYSCWFPPSPIFNFNYNHLSANFEMMIIRTIIDNVIAVFADILEIIGNSLTSIDMCSSIFVRILLYSWFLPQIQLIVYQVDEAAFETDEERALWSTFLSLRSKIHPGKHNLIYLCIGVCLASFFFCFVEHDAFPTYRCPTWVKQLFLFIVYY